MKTKPFKKNDVRIAIQKSGRLSDETVGLLNKCGVRFPKNRDKLLVKSNSFDAELMLVRDDDIPRYISEGTCTLGIVGENTLLESNQQSPLKIVRRLGFSKCRLSIATKKGTVVKKIEDLQGMRIATSVSYTHLTLPTKRIV